jgi:hypothetical protein
MNHARTLRSLLVILLLAGGCATASSTGARNGNTIAGFTGIWKGTMTSSTTGKIAKIRFDVKNEDGKIKGTYLCSAGNANCRNNVHTGTVDGKVGNSGFRVVLEDSSWCAFNADFYPENAQGDYSCYDQGALVDQGVWRIEKVSDAHPFPPLPHSAGSNS